ncbi:MAG: Coenzyme F420 hydrogenase/dehydrogenase, beta subunit C-terminal domain [Candidatus Lokiarchaeota archaeon]
MTESKGIIKNGKNVRTFEDLNEDVVQAGKCCACGACISYCESQSFDVIKMENHVPQFKSDENADNCTVEDEIGKREDILAAKTTHEQIKEVGQDGGIVTTILKYLFDRHKIDAAVVSEYNDQLETEPKIIFDKEELLKSSGTRYSVSSQVLPLKDLYNISLEIQKKKGIYDIDQLRLAFVGTPCQVRAIRKMKFLNIKPAHVIQYIISLFCYENFDYDKLYEILEKETKIKSTNIKSTFIKKNFFINTKDDTQIEVDIKKLDPAVRNTCQSCDEFTGRFSDISVGSSGAPKGYSMIIMRNEKGQKLISQLISQNYIEQYVVPPEKSKEWQDAKVKGFKRMIRLKSK